MYADDTKVPFAASDIPGLETKISTELKSINLWLRANKLSLNVRQKLSLLSLARVKNCIL